MKDAKISMVIEDDEIDDSAYKVSLLVRRVDTDGELLGEGVPIIHVISCLGEAINKLVLNYVPKDRREEFINGFYAQLHRSFYERSSIGNIRIQ